LRRNNGEDTVNVWRMVVVGVAFVAGVVVGVAGSASKADPSMYSGKSSAEAVLALGAAAQSQAGKGSWENIGVARLYYLAGEKANGRAILDRVTAGKMKKDDWLRVGRLFAEAREWDKAQAAFDKAISLDPKDAEYLAEVGAWYNLFGNRAKAEEFFAASLKIKPEEVWNTLNIAGSYAGIKPQ
jgi:Flp pilus assembly protein TadD